MALEFWKIQQTTAKLDYQSAKSKKSENLIIDDVLFNCMKILLNFLLTFFVNLRLYK